MSPRTSTLFVMSLFLLIGVFAAAGEHDDHVHDTSSHCKEDNSTETLSTDHKDLFPMNGYDIAGTFLAFIGAAFANAGGAGGGGIFVPLLILLVQFTPHGAIPLSKAMIFGGALTFVSITFRRRHPEANMPLIDYNIAVMFEPMVLCGTTVGVLLNRVFPSWMLLACLELLLVITVYRTLKKGFSKYKAESASGASSMRIERENSPRLIDALQNNDAKDGQMTGVADIELAAVHADPKDTDGDDHASETTASDGMISTEATSFKPSGTAELDLIRDKESKIMPLDKVLLICGVWVFIMILALMRGGHGAGSIVGIENCSAGYWTLTFLVFPVCLAVTFWVGKKLRAEHELKVRGGYAFKEGMVQWNKKNSIVFPLCCFFAGCAAGLLGIGGGLVLGPLLLEMRVRPEVAAATSSLMVLFTASCTSIQFVRSYESSLVLLNRSTLTTIITCAGDSWTASV